MVTNDLISGMFKGLSIGADPFRDEYRVDAYAARSGRGPGVSRNDFSAGAKTMRLLRPDVARSPFGGYTAWRGPTSVTALGEDAEWLKYQDMHASGDIRRLQNVHGAALLTELGVQVAITGLSTAAGVGALGYHAQMAALGIGAGFSADAAGTAFGSGNYGEGTAYAALSATAAFSLGSNIASSVASRAGLNAATGAPYEFGRSLHQGHGVRAAQAAANPAGRRAVVTGPPQGFASAADYQAEWAKLKAMEVVAPPRGRLGSASTRQQISDVANQMEARGWTITGGGGRLPEEYLPGPGGARTGSSFPDISATRSGKTLRVNTVDTYADGVTPTKREALNATRIRFQTPGDHLLLIPKPK